MIHKTIAEKNEKLFIYLFFFQAKSKKKKNKTLKKKCRRKMKKKSIIKVKINAQYAYAGELNESKKDNSEKKNQNLFRRKIFLIMKMKNRIKISQKKITKIVKL